MSFRAEHSERGHAFTVAKPLHEAFRLFEPEGERIWAEGWNPVYLYPADGKAGAGMVFTTSHGNEETIWTMTRHDPAAGLVEYVRTSPGSRIGRVLVQCSALDAARTRVNVVYAFTGLSESGNARIRELDEARYREFVESWGKAIERALAR
jgi:hypothetical protein